MFIRISYASQNKILLGWPQDLGTAPNPTRRAVGRGAVFEAPTIPTTPPHRPQGVHEGLGGVTLSVFPIRVPAPWWSECPFLHLI
jgi:hypothetical protein